MAWYRPPFRAFPDGSDWGFFTPLVIFAVFFLVQLILPGKWVPGYVINPETGEPRTYRLNGILVFAIALIVWAFELTGLTCGPHGRVAGVDRRGVVCRTLMFWPGNRLPKFGRSEAAKTAISSQPSA